MKRLLLLTILSLFTFLLHASTPELNSLFRDLDQAILNRPEYAQKRELRIDSLKLELKAMSNDDLRFQTYQKLLKEYRSYNMDSALWVANKRLALAEKLDNLSYIRLSETNIAEIMGVMGMYKESLDIVDKIDKKELDESDWPYYYHVHHSTYSLLFENAQSQKEKEYYKGLITLYKDSLLQTNDRNSLGYSLVLNGKLVDNGKYDEALAMMIRCYDEYGDNEALVGTIAYGLSDVYGKLGDVEQEKKYLATSAIADLHKAVKGYIALRKLAIMLYKEGDVDRAYRYIKCSMEDATYCKARFRTLEIAEALPIITAAYDKKAKEEKDNLIKYLLLISILSCVLIISIIYIYKQLQKLSAARKSIKRMYINAKQMNDDLNQLNKKLSESNHVKEEYIGYVFNLCSSYIDKMEAYRININRRLKAGLVEEVVKLTKSTSLVSDELKDFFQNFDATFLNIYPNFVEEFNALLLEEEQITPKTGDILTSEMRVFALVRLGISDSSRIASFLHYSPQTVYNYRLKVKNKLRVSKKDFDDAILQIGK